MLDKEHIMDIDKRKEIVVVADQGRVIEMQMLHDAMKDQAERKQQLREQIERAGYTISDAELDAIAYSYQAEVYVHLCRHNNKSSRMLEELQELFKQEELSAEEMKAVKDENKKNTRKFLETKYKNKGRRK